MDSDVEEFFEDFNISYKEFKKIKKKYSDEIDDFNSELVSFFSEFNSDSLKEVLEFYREYKDEIEDAINNQEVFNFLKENCFDLSDLRKAFEKDFHKVDSSVISFLENFDSDGKDYLLKCVSNYSQEVKFLSKHEEILDLFKEFFPKITQTTFYKTILPFVSENYYELKKLSKISLILY